ncbi:MAG: DUF2207 domain-containing protein, partial [Candidatus Micrarchaeia archaeon]
MERNSSVVFLLLLLLSVSFAKDYSIPSATAVYVLNVDGTISVQEKVTYQLDGEFSYLYLRPPSTLEIEDFSGYCENVDCNFSVVKYLGIDIIELRLNGPFNTQSVNAVFNYKIKNGILEQKDTAQFLLKLRGDECKIGAYSEISDQNDSIKYYRALRGWKCEKEVGALTAIIVFPNNASDVVYFVHSPHLANIGLINLASGNTIKVTSYNHPPKTYLEINSLIPKEWFSNLTPAKNYMTKEEIIKGEFAHTVLNTLFNLGGLTIYLVPLIIYLFPLLYFIYIYFKYGTEIAVPELKTLPPYERDPPNRL